MVDVQLIHQQSTFLEASILEYQQQHQSNQLGPESVLKVRNHIF